MATGRISPGAIIPAAVQIASRQDVAAACRGDSLPAILLRSIGLGNS